MPQFFGALRRLKHGESPKAVAETCGITKFKTVGPSPGQLWKLESEGLPWRRPNNRREATLLIDAKLKPLLWYRRRLREIDKATNRPDLDAVGRDLVLVRDVLPPQHFSALCEAGKKRRIEIEGNDKIPE